MNNSKKNIQNINYHLLRSRFRPISEKNNVLFFECAQKVGIDVEEIPRYTDYILTLRSEILDEQSEEEISSIPLSAEAKKVIYDNLSYSIFSEDYVKYLKYITVLISANYVDYINILAVKGETQLDDDLYTYSLISRNYFLIKMGLVLLPIELFTLIFENDKLDNMSVDIINNDYNLLNLFRIKKNYFTAIGDYPHILKNSNIGENTYIRNLFSSDLQLFEQVSFNKYINDFLKFLTERDYEYFESSEFVNFIGKIDIRSVFDEDKYSTDVSILIGMSAYLSYVETIYNILIERENVPAYKLLLWLMNMPYYTNEIAFKVDAIVQNLGGFYKEHMENKFENIFTSKVIREYRRDYVLLEEIINTISLDSFQLSRKANMVNEMSREQFVLAKTSVF